MSENGLACSNLTFQRPGSGTILDGVDAAFASGQSSLVTGPTGAGKSTLLHLLGGMLRPTSGDVRTDGRPVSRLPVAHLDLWRRNVGMVFQHLHLLSDLTVLENVLLPHIPRSSAWSDLTADAEALLARLDLGARRQAAVRELSGGQRQRVAIARALMIRPRFFLLDEPTSFQDDTWTARLIGILSETADQGSCVVVCSHDRRLLEAREVFHHRYRLFNRRLETCS